MQKIRLAIMTDEFDRRPERTLFFRRLIESCIKDPRFEVTLVHSQSLPEEPLYKKTHEVVMPRVRLPWGSHFATYIRYCLATKDEYDIVHYFKPRLYPFFWLFPAKHVVVMAHGGGDRLAPGFWTVPRFIFVWTLILFQKHVDALIAVSEYANREIIYAYHFPPEKVFTIHPHLDQIYAEQPTDVVIRDTLSSYGLEVGTYFVYIGRAVLHKNTGNLVEAYLRYRERNPSAREILALGGDSKIIYERTRPIRPSPYAKDIRFIGYIATEDLPSIYKGARALSFVTLNEGFGVPIIEAFACGTPVITSSVTAMPEVAGNAALIVDPRNPDALAEALRRISIDETLRKELIRRGLERSKFFTWDKVVEQTFTLYQHVLGRNSSAVFDPTAQAQDA